MRSIWKRCLSPKEQFGNPETVDDDAFVAARIPMTTLTPARDLPLQLLKERDYSIILGRSCISHRVPHLARSWEQAQDAIRALVSACTELDRDGVVLYVASEISKAPFGFQKYEQVTGDRLPELLDNGFPPSNFDFVGVLEAAIDDYFERKALGTAQPNGEIFLVVLDGEPVDRKHLSQLVIATTKRMDHKDELAIGLIQIGDDSMAEGLFNVLDDDLQDTGAVYDMVHTQKIETLNLENLSAFLWDVLTD